MGYQVDANYISFHSSKIKITKPKRN